VARARRALSALLLSVLLLAACTGDEQSEANPEATPAGTDIGFDMEGGDSYSWVEEVVGNAECDDLSLEINGEPANVSIRKEDTAFAARVPLVSGDNEVVAVCTDGSGRSEPIMFRQRLSLRPTARIDVDVEGDRVTLDARGTKPAQPDGAELTDFAWTPGSLRRGLRTQGKLSLARGRIFRSHHGQRLRLLAPTRDGEYFVTLDVTDGDGLTDTTATYFVVEGGRAREVDMMREHPEWIDDAVIYAPIPQLWGNGGPKSVARRLPYLQDLGVDALWLWPPTTLRTAGEEYAIEDYFDVDPSWGPEPALKEMVEEAHRLGMYVLVDFVPNHMSAEGPYFQGAESDGRVSPYWDFFDRRKGEYTHYFDWDNLPNLNFDNQEVRNMIMESTAHWVRDIGVDGFRIDVAWGVKRRRPGFWPKWRREMKRVNPDVLLLAEASATDPYYFSHGFDVAYDWTRELGQWAWASAFEFPEEAGALLQDAITNGGKGYSRDALIMRFLNNNDTGIRFVDQHGPKLTKVAATMQFTLPGTPAMFGGDEIGASYEPYSNLTPIRWRDEHGLRPHYKRLIELKHREPALGSRELDLLETNSTSVVAYVRPGPDGRVPLLVIDNFGSKTQVQLSGSQLLDSVRPPSSGTLRDLLTNRRVDVIARPGSASVTVPAKTSLVLSARS
jgi:cyclomaltodextrinase / maltogenic alpha-amylase / neopullulanase